MAQGVSCWILTSKTLLLSQTSTCTTCIGQSGTVSGFFPSTSVFPCQYHSTNAPYPFIHLPPTLYNVSLPVLQFSPVSTIPPVLHTHSFTYHPHYTMFLSQHFSFPCQYHSTHSFTYHPHYTFLSQHLSFPCQYHSTHSFTYHPHYRMFLSQHFSFPCQYHSTSAPHPFIHLPPTLYIVSLQALQFPLSVPFHPFIHLPPTLYNVSLPALQFPLSVQFHQRSITLHSPTIHAT